MLQGGGIGENDDIRFGSDEDSDAGSSVPGNSKTDRIMSDQNVRGGNVWIGVKGVINDTVRRSFSLNEEALLNGTLRSGWLERQLRPKWGGDIDDMIKDLEEEEDSFVKEYTVKRLMEIAMMSAAPRFGTLKMDKLNIDLSNANWKLAAAAALGFVSAVAVVSVSQSVSKKNKVRKIKDEFRSLSHFPPINQLPASDLKQVKPVVPEELIREQLSRNYSFLGEDGMKSVRGAFVIVVGLGGVGSHAAHMLVRSGVQKIRIIDFDQVSLSSLNRHAVAIHADVGTSKAACLQKHFKEIAPQAEVEAINELFNINVADRLLAGNPDYVLDCIDNLNTKIDLIKYCHDHKLPIIASMGAGAKADPSRIQIADVSDTSEDPLARATRQGLKKLGVSSGVPVVYSTEKPGKVKLLPMEAAKVEDADEYATLPHFRSRILPVLGTLPALFGMAMASFVICALGKFEMEPLPIKLRTRVYANILAGIQKIRKPIDGDLQITVQDIGFILEEIYFGKSIISGAAEKEKVILTRWDSSKPYKMDNMVAMTKNEAEAHAALVFSKVESHYGKEFVAKVERKLQNIRDVNKWRE
ncbi:UNVERIFIED_CONTAM: hypothetical protein HDU68_008570 [Siphonaria sp. JEL0065]|nr:hypothetical protein HDU68_008570 [Siphonaria sp. JEL0065]